MGKRWITGQEIIDEFGLQPFELRDIIAATKEGKTSSGQDVGYAAYLVQLNGTYPIICRHTEIARSMSSALMAYERLEEIEKQRQVKTVYQQDGETMSLHVGNNTPIDERIGVYYALTPSKYKTETGINIESFFNDIPTFVFTEDEYATIKKIVEEEGLAPADDPPVSVAAPHDALIAEAEMEEPEEGTINNATSSPCRGRKQKLDDMECLKIYRQHYEDNGLSIATLAKEYDWSNSPFADTPKFETAKSRINKALKRGHELTPPHARPAKDNVGQK